MKKLLLSLLVTSAFLPLIAKDKEPIIIIEGEKKPGIEVYDFWLKGSFNRVLESDAEYFYMGLSNYCYDGKTDKTTITIKLYKKLVHISELLNIFIGKCADRLYCQAELNGGGENGVDYQKVINEYVEKLRAVLQRKDVLVNQKDEEGRTPLMNVACHYQWESMQLLIEAGADITLTDNKGLTALDYLRLRNSAKSPSITFIINIIMGNYYTKARYNKCITLLIPDIKERWWYKRWIF